MSTFPFAQRVRASELSLSSHEGQTVTVCGRIWSKRDHGGLLFLDLRDETATVQVVCHPGQALFQAMKRAPEHATVGVVGSVRRRPAGTENPKLATGDLEIVAERFEVFAPSAPLPFALNDEVDENVRLRYRYVDLRREKMQRILRLRSAMAQAVRETLWEKGFVELETPYLIKSTPEGARDFLVPSRFFPGKFYALPQSPQLFKQILMMADFERYFQIARCFRDEDLRADRQPEFTQVDLEMAYVDEEAVMQLVEEVTMRAFAAAGKKIRSPFPRIGYEEAVETYGGDRPDLRLPLPLRDVSDLAKQSEFQVFTATVAKGGVVKGINAKGMGGASRKRLDELTKAAQNLGAKGLAWFAFRSGQLSSPIAKFFPQATLQAIGERMEAEEGDLLLFVADKPKVALHVLSLLRGRLAGEIGRGEELAFCWVTDFPLFVYSETEGRLVSHHHPFTRPREEQIELLSSAPEKVSSCAYDLVLNGVEIGGGSLRIHDPALQAKILEILQIPPEEAEARFGFFLEALKYGAPPHGGIALGLDRMVMLAAGAESIREVIPFPKTQTGTCLLTQAPYEVESRQLRELHLKVRGMEREEERRGGAKGA